MNIDIIIEEELNEARERIKGRIASMLMGGVASPAPPARPSGHVKTSAPGRLKGFNAQIDDDEASLMQFIGDNPGCYSEDLLRALGVTMSTDRRYINVMKRLWKLEKILTRGKARATTYYVNERAPVPSARPVNPPPKNGRIAESDRQRSSPSNKLDVGGAKKRDNIILAHLKKHPNITAPEIRDAFEGQASMGTPDSILSAIHRLFHRGRIAKKKKAGTGQVLLRVK